MQITSSSVKYIKEYDNNNGGNNSNIPVSDFIPLPCEIPDPQDTKIFRCYDGDKKLLGEIRPKLDDVFFNISFDKNNISV